MKQTVQTLQAMKERGEKIAMLTCYDYTMAKLMDAAGALTPFWWAIRSA